MQNKVTQRKKMWKARVDQPDRPEVDVELRHSLQATESDSAYWSLQIKC